MRWGCCNKLEIQDGGRLGCSCISGRFFVGQRGSGCLFVVFSAKLGTEDLNVLKLDKIFANIQLIVRSQNVEIFEFLEMSDISLPVHLHAIRFKFSQILPPSTVISAA